MRNKNTAIENITLDFEVLAETSIKQLNLIEELIIDNKADVNKLCNEIQRNEIIIDTFELKINDGVINTIVLYKPVAGDLRNIISCMRMASSLERISDLALNICEFFHKMDNKETLSHFTSSLKNMIKLAKEMVKNALLAYSAEDINMSNKVIETDDKVDNLLTEISKQIMGKSNNNTDFNMEMNSLICLNNIAYNIERIADNATNIAEAVIYMLKGKDIRHSDNK